MRAVAAAAALALALGAGPAIAASEPRAFVGAASPPAGGVVVSGEGGMMVVIPTLSLAANVGLGGGASAELRYRNIGGLGHAGRLRLAWGRQIDRGLVWGVAARTSITSLAQANGRLVGVEMGNLALGNDWLVGGDLSLTWLRPRKAQVTASIGPTFTLGGARYRSYDERGFRMDPAVRALTGSVQGEWEVRPSLHAYLRLDADVLLRAQIMPLGFLPTGSVGLAASLGAPPAHVAEAPARPRPPVGSLVTTAPLGAGRVGMLLGGGVAVILPFYEVEMGVGLSPRVDLVGRFESVLGLLHYPSVGVRWSPVDLGRWKLGLNASANYSFFGIATDQLEFTSTFYLTLEAGLSGPVTPATDLFFSVDNEVDLFEYRSLDGQGSTRGTFHYDATLFRVGAKTRLNDDLDGFVRARVRIPVETFRYQAMSFYMIPSLEIGGSFGF